ncbi:MAG: hypothetical protein CAPSK01_002190 [Candidatus Accumulibacter vicinus]|uniref:Uncharacterized protein n=1 Tax=Candidatus Accumulibacter vicinus TaxID=2954382 RepID=A0A084Y0U2_9PROT|nr:MAG: hypothetical protein CAPSK01_002190 [Candidatus Accumulibacter vicinus]
MVKLDQRHIVEEIQIPGIDDEAFRRQHMPVHQGKAVVGLAGTNASDKAAGNDHVANQDRQPEAGPLQPLQRNVAAAPAALAEQAQRHPEHRQENQEGQRQMRGQPIVTDARVVDQAALDHVPAHRSL